MATTKLRSAISDERPLARVQEHNPTDNAEGIIGIHPSTEIKIMESDINVPVSSEKTADTQFARGKPHGSHAPPPGAAADALVEIPGYLREVYTWAYLNPLSVWLLDRTWVVNAILWGNNRRLQRAVFAELEPGSRVLQACCVYGDFSPELAQWLGPEGQLEVIDVAPIQLAACRRKLQDNPRVTTRRADAAAPGGGPYDAVVCFFLLHELPETYKHAVVDALLGSIAPGGKIIFIDFHKPRPAHPLKWFTAAVFALLEPFAKSLWRHSISDFATDAGRYGWRTETYFGGLFQKTIARRPKP
jgi:ubiquinone/menaquinone biosynthesis C-methylase UbiE